ncbi:uncharacterized protein LOC103520909 [Diaphorina citri]|uniref:Uncharacterized protein LOC103520909 n=1 Tax=Diaphorina citri TaxID=121845 RepID=A0A1S3DLD5_DIACI|nr:uncharacterized protein LOC103520909 [Diaphorina citri]
MQGISVTLDNQKNTSVTKIKTTLGRETISKFTPRQVILNKTRERMSHSSGTTESDTSSETIDSANDKEGNNLKPTPKKRRERSFRDVLSLIQNTLLSLKVENGATPLSDSKTRKKLRVESPFIKTHVSCENETNSSSDSQLKKTQNNKPVALSETKQMQCSASLNNQRKVTVLPNTQYDLRENIMVTYVTNNLTTSKTCNTKGEMCTMKIQHRELGLTESKLTNDPLPDTSSPTNLFSKRKYRENQARNLYQDMENDGTSKYSNITNNTVHYTIPGLSKTYEDVNKNYNTPYTKMNTSTDSLNSALDTILPGDTSRRNVEPSNSELEVTQSAEETSRFILNIDYLTSEEKALMELKQSKKETIFHREKAHSGYDRLFLLRSNTIQFFQYVQAVCQYNSNYDINPIDERVFYSQIRTLRSPSAYELESKFYTSMLGRFEFYKFIKYISLNYVVPKMFSNQFKNVIFTSLLDKNSNCANYIIRNLDLSVYETHFSRLPSTPLNKSPKVDLIHLNEKGFELLKNCLTQAITQIRRESNF